MDTKKVLISLLAVLGLLSYYKINENFPEEGTNIGFLEPNEDIKIYKEYIKWKSDYKKTFNGEEDQYRYAIFKENYISIENFNDEQTDDLRLGLNQLADLTNEEYQYMYLRGYQPPENTPNYTVKYFDAPVDAPENLDWVKKGAVVPVENQGQCGSCWAFSSKSGLEGLNVIKGGQLTSFSAQQLVDCAGITGNLGCNGGDLIAAFQYTQQKGIQTTDSYPYHSGTSGKTGKCTYDKSKVVFQNKGQVKVAPANQASAIYSAIQDRPLSIEIAASSLTFQFYRKGTIKSTSKCGTKLDHGVFLTGYENKGGQVPNWVIKNSWGTQWGDQGYVKVEVQEHGPGTCGVQQYTSYPTI